MQWCKKCVYPEVAVDFTFNEEGICSGCLAKSETRKINWNLEFKNFKEILYKYKSKNNYDCIIPVSGGKDSYFQTYIVKKKLGLNPLLVTYNGHNYLDVGLENLKNMREAFGCDHYFFTPSLNTIKELNILGFKLTGDPNWHAHAGISTLPFIISVKFKIPLIIWGEHASDLNGKNFLSEKIEWTKRERDEKDLRGFDINDFLKKSKKIKKTDLLFFYYPTDEEINSVGTRGIFLGNYVKWDGNYNYQIAKKFGFKIPKKKFQRTYRIFSNLDDRYENGLHDYMKFVKYGYGRTTDHASRDIRLGKINRKTAVKLVKKYDSVIPDDLYYWLKYVGMSEKEFWRIANSFRDKRVWKFKSGVWTKDNIWDQKKSL